MLIYLRDLDNDEELAADLTVESTVPCQDLFALFHTRHQGSEQAPVPYREYYCQRVNHLTVGSLYYGGQKYTLTLGFYLRDGRFIPFVVDQVCSDPKRYQRGNRFGTALDSYDHYFHEHTLFHYPGAPSLLDAEGRPQSFQQVLTQALQGGPGENKAFALGRASDSKAERLISEQELDEVLGRQAAVPKA